MITITANGYQGLKAEVAEILPTGAYVIVNRKGIDLAPRKMFFNNDAIKELAGSMVTAELPITKAPEMPEADTETPGEMTWGTWKTHGKATEGFYYGCRLNEPWTAGVRVTVRADRSRGVVIETKDGEPLPKSLRNETWFGVAGRFYFAPIA